MRPSHKISNWSNKLHSISVVCFNETLLMSMQIIRFSAALGIISVLALINNTFSADSLGVRTRNNVLLIFTIENSIIVRGHKITYLYKGTTWNTWRVQTNQKSSHCREKVFCFALFVRKALKLGMGDELTTWKETIILTIISWRTKKQIVLTPNR